MSKSKQKKSSFTNHLGTIIKIIAFLVAIIIMLTSILLAVVLYTKEPIFLVVSSAIAVLGSLISIVLLFIIYGIGHIVTQNNEIIKNINK